jgi:hypothetical protein
MARAGYHPDAVLQSVRLDARGATVYKPRFHDT